MEKLISGQSIRIDNHKGGGIVTCKGLHIHKIMNTDRYSGAEIIIPLDSNSDITINAKGKDTLRLKNEINRALQDKEKRCQFVKDTLNVIAKYSSNDADQRMKNVITGAKAIAKYFGLSVEEESVEIIKDTYCTECFDDNGKKFYIIQDLQGKSIKIGDDINTLEEFEQRIKEIF